MYVLFDYIYIILNFKHAPSAKSLLFTLAKPFSLTATIHSPPSLSLSSSLYVYANINLLSALIPILSL